MAEEETLKEKLDEATSLEPHQGHDNIDNDHLPKDSTIGRKASCSDDLSLRTSPAGDLNTPKRAQHRTTTTTTMSPMGTSAEYPQHHDAKVGTRGITVSSPSWERIRGSSDRSHGSAPSTPRSSKLRPAARGNETTPDKSASVPKFGDWNESDPSSADSYTGIFNRVRDEIQGGPGNILPGSGADNHLPSGQTQHNYDNSKRAYCCCLPRGQN